MVHISIGWCYCIRRGIGHRSSYSSNGSISTRRIRSWQIGSKTLLKLAVDVDDIFILVELIFTILGLWVLVGVGALRPSESLWLVEDLEILLMHSTLTPWEGVSILLLLLRSVVVDIGSEHTDFICRILELGSGAALLIWEAIVAWFVDLNNWPICERVGAIQQILVRSRGISHLFRILRSLLLVLILQEVFEFSTTSFTKPRRGRLAVVWLGVVDLDICLGVNEWWRFLMRVHCCYNSSILMYLAGLVASLSIHFKVWAGCSI